MTNRILNGVMAAVAVALSLIWLTAFGLVFLVTWPVFHLMIPRRVK